jgi:hypothetical protein
MPDNRLLPKFSQIIVNKNSLPTSKVTRVSTTTTDFLMLFMEIIAAYCDNHKEHINTPCRQNARVFNVIAHGTPSGHCALKGYQTINYTYKEIRTHDHALYLQTYHERINGQ